MKRLIIFVLVVGGLIGAAIAAAPLIAATDLAKRRIATQIEEWTGQPVTFSGEPKVKLFPFLSVTIEDAAIGERSGANGVPLVVMDELTCKLRLLPFLIGRTDVAEFQLVRPHFRLSVNGDGRSNWTMSHGSVASQALGIAGKMHVKGSDTPSKIAEVKLGRFKIVDGTVSYTNSLDGYREDIKSLNLNLRWPQSAEAASGSGSLNWRGELVEFNGQINDPLQLIGGDSSAARFAIASKPLRVSFTGAANRLSDIQLEGATTLTTPSVRRVAEWLGADMGDGSILGAALIEGNLNWIGPSFSFSTAKVELDGNSAEGTLAIDVSDRRPRIQGTLALEKLDLSAYLETFQAGISADGPWPLAEIGMPLLDIADVDLRLSAGEILIGSARIGQSAGSVGLNSGKLSVDIGEAQFYGGSLESSTMIEMQDGTMVGNVDIALDGVPAGVALTGLTGYSLIDGRTTAAISLRGRGETWSEFAQNLTGTTRIEIADGALIGIELGQLAALSGGFGVADPGAGTGTVPFDMMAGTLEIADGAILGENVHVTGETFSIDLSGRLSLFGAGIQAKGVLHASKRAAQTNTRREIPFVVGGSWAAPLLLPDYERLIRRGVAGQSSNPTVDPAQDTIRPNG